MEYIIFTKNGFSLGTYQAISEEHALDLVAQDAGYHSYVELCSRLNQDQQLTAEAWQGDD